MTIPVLITIAGTQKFPGEKPETIELVTQGNYTYEPGLITLSYVETQMTGLEGVVTSFTVENGEKVTLTREGKVNSVMTFIPGEKDTSLYETGYGGLMLTVSTRQMTVLLNEQGGILDLEYAVEIEQTACGTNAYHIVVRPIS